MGGAVLEPQAAVALPRVKVFAGLRPPTARRVDADRPERLRYRRQMPSGFGMPFILTI